MTDYQGNPPYIFSGLHTSPLLEFKSPIPHMLHTNFVPSEAQSNEIRESISDSLKSLDDLDSEISSLKARVAQLLEQREKLCADISAHQALVTPARRLPRDIIQEIFVACLPADRNPVMTSSDPPMLLGQIYSFWRDIALSTPCLWSSLHIVIPGSAEMIHRIGHAIKIWLSRSGVLPLSIKVVLSRTYSDDLQDKVAEIFTTLSMYKRRWRDIEFLFALASEALLSSLAAIPTDDVPLLGSFLLCSWIKDSESVVHLPLFDAPNLRNASINSFGHSPIFPTSWLSLTELHLNTGDGSGRSLGFSRPGLHLGATTFLSPRAAIDILRRCPNLEISSLEVTQDYTEANIVVANDHTFGPPLTLEKLRILSIAFPHRRPPDIFFQTLIIPKLESFTFSGCAGKLRLPFLSLFTETNRLTHLNIILRRFKIGPILEGLRLAPDIKTLKLTSVEGTQWGSWFANENPAPQPHEELLTLLTPSTAQLVCPRLTKIELDNCTHFSDAGLLQLLQARLGNWDGMDRLEYFSAGFNREREADIMPELQPLIEVANATVSLKYPASYVPPQPQPYSPWEGANGPIAYFHPDDPWPSNRW
ncbi:hypothetical protein B0H10DRAFT_1988635 [Mycena sp. CBHHK59/15]|nr:hypothetical protein B0H10DRAFT_1988635 [Mycena sp. CBHHK59/15]